jgi:hypothetical protein
MTFRLESHMTKDNIIMMQLKGDGHVVGFASFGLDVVKEFIGACLVLAEKMEGAGLVDPINLEVGPLPDSWN